MSGSLLRLKELYLTDKTVKQIAYELGYEDEFYFSRFFKSKYRHISAAISGYSWFCKGA